MYEPSTSMMNGALQLRKLLTSATNTILCWCMTLESPSLNKSFCRAKRNSRKIRFLGLLRFVANSMRHCVVDLPSVVETNLTLRYRIMPTYITLIIPPISVGHGTLICSFNDVLIVNRTGPTFRKGGDGIMTSLAS